MKKQIRTVVSSLNLLTMLFLLGVLFIMVNWVSSRRYIRWDFTKEQITKLSDQTTQALKTLKEPLTVTVFYQPNHRLFDLVSDLLKEYGQVSPQLKVEYIDPEQDIARARQLAEQFQIEALNVVVFQSGSRHKHVSDADLADFDYSVMQMGAQQPRVSAFKGEEAFTSAIINVTQTTQPLVWFTSGHGEKSVSAIQDPQGLSELKKYLEQQNIKVEEVAILERSSIPAEVKLVVIAGPKRRFIDSEMALLQTYLEQGGRLLALIDPLTDTGLEAFLERWGIRLGNDIVVDPSRQLPFVSAANLFVTTYTQHPIVEKMQTLMTLYPLSRSVRPVEQAPAGLTVQPLALTSPQGWGETNTGTDVFEQQPEDLAGPVAIATASEKAPPPANTSGSTPPAARMVVFGDSDFIIDAQLGNVGNKDILLGSVYWLIEQEQLIGISPRTLQSVKLSLTAQELSRLVWFSILAMPLLCGIAGTGVWWLRRR
jgi:ABC-type uncharacterized transport system involved in gliding motility auxiliary subunit